MHLSPPGNAEVCLYLRTQYLYAKCGRLRHWHYSRLDLSCSLSWQSLRARPLQELANPANQREPQVYERVYLPAQKGLLAAYPRTSQGKGQQPCSRESAVERGLCLVVPLVQPGENLHSVTV